MPEVHFRAENKFEVDKAFLDLHDVDRDTARGVRQGFFKIGQRLLAIANRNILDKTKKTGRIYIRRDRAGRRRRHQASAPGETHANMTGALRKSIGWKVKGAESLTFQYGADGRLPPLYDSAIEFGTKDGHIKPRPSLRNAIGEVDRDAEKYFEENIIKELNK